MATIWDDPDVAAIVDVVGGHQLLRFEELDEGRRDEAWRFIRRDLEVTVTSSPAQALAACLDGIRFAERLPEHLPGCNARGWRKLAVYKTAANAQILWEQHGDVHAVVVGAWVLESLRSLGVTTDGYATALGTAYATTLATHGPRATSGDGDDGRALAGVW